VADKKFPMYFVNTSDADQYVNFSFKKAEQNNNRVEFNGEDYQGEFSIKILPKLTTLMNLWSKNTPFFATTIGSFTMGKNKDKGGVSMKIISSGNAYLSMSQMGGSDDPWVLFDENHARSDEVSPNKYLMTFASSIEDRPPLTYGSPTASIIFAPKYGVHGKNYELEFKDEVEGKIFKVKSYGLINNLKLSFKITPIIVFGVSGWANNFFCKVRDLDSGKIVDEFDFSFICFEGRESVSGFASVGGGVEVKGGKHVVLKGEVDRIGGGQGQKANWPGHGTISIYYSN
jgi:hypothetical protein